MDKQLCPVVIPRCSPSGPVARYLDHTSFPWRELHSPVQASLDQNGFLAPFHHSVPDDGKEEEKLRAVLKDWPKTKAPRRQLGHSIIALLGL